jgi:hypothetical protein
MSFLNNLGQKISDVSQTTIKKTKDLADTAKLNLNISEEERKIERKVNSTKNDVKGKRVAITR